MTTKKYRLNDSKSFCMAPWVGIYNKPSGDITPCCLARINSFGNLYDDSIEEIWNNQTFKDFRKSLLNDEENPICKTCHKSEEWGTNSYRRFWNELYSSKYDEVISATDPDGTLNTMNFYRWDFRYNNLCNLACIGCSPEFSSSWVEQQKKMYPDARETQDLKIYSSRQNKDRFLETIKTQAKIVDNIYFAGGEPLMHPEHYEIMKELDSLDKIDKIDFMYSTNLTNLYYKNYCVTDYLKKMKKVKLVVSIDEVDPDRLYYLRYPSNLDQIVENIKVLNTVLTSVDKHWSIVPTWNVLNLHRMKDIVGYFKDNELLPYAFYRSVSWEMDMHNIILMHPEHLSISAANPEWKQYLHTKLNEFEEWYKDVMIPMKSPNVRFFATRILEGNMNKFRNALDENNTNQSLEYYKKLDEVRGTDFLKTFPELDWFLK